jgi:hypothetical protein
VDSEVASVVFSAVTILSLPPVSFQLFLLFPTPLIVPLPVHPQPLPARVMAVFSAVLSEALPALLEVSLVLSPVLSVVS